MNADRNVDIVAHLPEILDICNGGVMCSATVMWELLIVFEEAA